MILKKVEKVRECGYYKDECEQEKRKSQWRKNQSGYAAELKLDEKIVLNFYS